MFSLEAISEIALIFVANEDFAPQMNQALAILGQTLGVSRCYLFLDSEDGSTTTNTYEWCAEGGEPQISNRQNIPYSEIPSWKKILEEKIILAVEDVSSLPVDVKNVLEPRGIQAIIVAPLRIGDVVRGFLGLDECTGLRSWNEFEIESLKMIAGIISTAYSKKLLTERLSIWETNFRNFFNTVDDIILVGDLNGRIVFANEGATRKLGFSCEDLIGKHILDLHPPDKRDEAGRILEAMIQKELARCPLELWTRDKTRLPVETRVWFGQWNGRDCIFGISKDLSTEQAALQKFERLFQGNPALMAVSRIDNWRFVDVNEAFLQRFGYEREEVIGHSSLDLGIIVDTEHYQSVRKELGQVGKVRNRKLTLRSKDGDLIHGLFSGDVIDSQGERFFLTVMVDITQQVNLQNELEVEHQRLRNIIEGTRLGTWEWNIQTGETTFNDRWAEMVGYSLAALAPTTIKTWTGLAHPDDLAKSNRFLNLHFSGVTEYYEFESRMRHKNGAWIWVLDRGKVIERDSEGRPLKMYGTHSDVTEKKAMQDQIQNLAMRDPLTRVYNRRNIFDRLDGIISEYVRAGRNFCISILDIDHFKAVNDTYGHQAGDFILKEFVRAISSTIRPYDLLGRYGGEEFIIVSPGAKAPETITLIERIMEMIRGKSFSFQGHDIRITFSCGLADSSEFTREKFSIDDMIALVDKRLYLAKEGGRDRFVGPG